MENRQNYRLLIDHWYDEWFAMDRFYYEWARRKGLTLTGLFTLYVIDTHEEYCTPVEIAEKLARSRQTVNSALDHLESLGIIQRQKDPRDGRSKVISFTDEGRRYVRQLLDELEEMEISAIQSISLKDTSTMVNTMRRMLHSLNNTLGEDSAPL